METVLVAKLQGNGPLNILIANRFEPSLVAQGESLPYVAYQVVSSNPMNVMGGVSDTTETRIQFDICSATYTQAKFIAGLVRDTLSGLRDLTTDPRILMMHLLNEIDDVENPSDDSAEPIYRVIQDYRVEHDPAP